MIQFIEDTEEGYAHRTEVNAQADVTIAFAKDFTTRGEKLTKSSVKKNNKLYIAVKPTIKNFNINETERVISLILKQYDRDQGITINIAGNGIYSLYSFCSQNNINEYMIKFLFVLKNRIKILSIRSGGQTGFDEAGLIAANNLNIPAICLAPKGWKFRNAFRQDIYDEKLFKERFV